ncbi:hypothetical protein BH11PLA2_BH11PLA2_50610 [soil metagenome]
MADAYQKRVQSIFLAAVEDHAPELWDDYLGTACEGEPELRQRVEALLRGHRQPNDLLDNPIAAPVAPSPASIGEGPGTIIGLYKLLEQIGEGGFGVVFMAEQQQPVRRKVALKIVKPGMDSRQVVARFEAERQALALMDHTNIAQIFDGGATESGRPYFVMELVRGIPITDFCNQHHLGVHKRLELFTHVCQAVQHAHQKGIIHRDLKPSNVMVTQHDVTPVVKIIDFGIAKATGQQLTDKTLFTNFAQLIGTPMYMSPEQAQLSGLDVDTRSDVYSLGVLLYELLTGNTPFDKARLRSVGYDEMIRIIREEEPVRPSTRISTLGHAANTTTIERSIPLQKLSQLLRGELDWIVMKALEKDRNRRYDSASALANDVQRHLHDEPVLACPPTMGYRLQKMARRHKAAIVTAAMVFAALSFGTAVAVWQAVVATQAKQIALNSAAAENAAKVVAEVKEAEAIAVISFLENRVLSAARPERLHGGLGHDVSLRRAIEGAVPFVQEGFKDQPLIEARLRMTLGRSFGYLGESQNSVDQYAAARDIYTRKLGEDHEFTLRSMSWLAASYNTSGRHTDACTLAEATLTKMRVKFGPEHQYTIDVMDNLGQIYSDLGRQNDALNIRVKAVKIRKATLGIEDPRTLQSLYNLTLSYAQLGRRREALPVLEEVFAKRKAILGPDHSDTLSAMNSLASTYTEVGRHHDACKMLEAVLALRKTILGFDHPFTLNSMHNLANTYGTLGRGEEALTLHQETLALRKARLGIDHIDTFLSMIGVANRYQSLGRNAEAIVLLEETLRRQKATLASNHIDTTFSMHNLAICYDKVGRHEDALKLAEETLSRRQSGMGIDHPGTLKTMTNVGIYYSALGRHAEALAVHQQCLSLRMAKSGFSNPDTYLSLVCVSRTLFNLKRGTEALPIIDDCIQRSLRAEAKTGFLADVMSLRMEQCYKLQDVAGCRATVAMWDTMNRTEAGELYGTARAHASMAWLIRNRDSTSEAEKESKTEEDLAMDWLLKAVVAGYRNTARLAKDPDIDILRNRPDFIKLMAELAVLSRNCAADFELDFQVEVAASRNEDCPR